MNNMSVSRRHFLSASALAVAGAGCVSATGTCGKSCSGRQTTSFHLGVAGYTFHKFDLKGALAELKKLGVDRFCAKSFHYPMDIPASKLAACVRQTKDAGVTLYGAGPISMNTPDEAKRAFDYCATLGVPVVVGVPGEKNAEGKTVSSRRMCECCARLADEYKMDFGIHNHGANPQTGNPLLYPTVVKTAEMICDLSPRMGFCMDIAYTQADGFDPCEILKTYAPRIFDIHLRNCAIPNNGSSGAPADAGIIDYVRIFRTLKAIGFNRTCGLELANAYGKSSEWNPNADPIWIPRSIGYFRGLMDAV